VIRVTLRQFRTEAIVGFGVLAVLAIVLAVTGPHLAQVNNTFQSACEAAGDCATASNPVFAVDKPLQSVLPFIATIAPALVGLFFGAPLIARELETGTFRLAWTQSITRRRWLGVKLGLVGLAAMTISGLLTWMVDWWAGPLDAANKNRFDLGPFAWHGVAPIGYAAFALVLGATAGVLLRRTVPAMAATLAGFVAVRLAVEHWIRPNLATPLHKSLSLLSTGFGVLGVSASARTFSVTPPRVIIPNDWVLSTAMVDKSGHALTGTHFLHACPAYKQFSSAPPQPTQIESAHAGCINKLSATFHTVVTYQPASRFWPFQWAEMGIFLAAALALCGLTYWWLRRQYA
jgi:hypothetical protein